MSIEEQLEAEYIRGEQAAARQIIRAVYEVIGEPDSEGARLSRAVDELASARHQLRSMFEEFEWEWPGDDLNLGDVIEKYVYRNVRDGV